MSLGTFLKSERRLRNLTQDDIATAVGVVVPVVSKWENDKSIPDLFALCTICNLLDLSIDEIVCRCRYGDGRDRILPPKVYDATVVGKRLCEFRIKNGLSQSEVGQKLYVTSQTVSKWECGAVTLLETLCKLSEFYGVTPSALICGLENTVNTATGNPQKRVRRLNKRLIKIMACILAVCLLASAFGGIYIEEYKSKSRADLAEFNSGTIESDGVETDSNGVEAEPESKKVYYLTIHTPDGKTEVHEFKFGEDRHIVPKYMSPDVVFLRYYENAVGTGRSWGYEDDYQLFSDLEVYPVYHTYWADFTAVKDINDTAHYYAIECERVLIENALLVWFLNFRDNFLNGGDSRRWQKFRTDVFKIDNSGGSFMFEKPSSDNTIYKSVIPDMIATAMTKTGDTQAFARLKSRLDSFVKIFTELNRDMQIEVYGDPDYDTKTAEEKRAFDVSVCDALLDKFLLRMQNLAKEFYGISDIPALWQSKILCDVLNGIWRISPETAIKYALPAEYHPI